MKVAAERHSVWIIASRVADKHATVGLTDPVCIVQTLIYFMPYNYVDCLAPLKKEETNKRHIKENQCSYIKYSIFLHLILI